MLPMELRFVVWLVRLWMATLGAVVGIAILAALFGA